MFCLPLPALLLEKLAVAFTEVAHAPGVVLAAIERKHEAADLEAHLDHIWGDHRQRLLAPRRYSPTSRGLQFAVLASVTAVAVWAVYIPRSSRFICLLACNPAAREEESTRPGSG